MVYFSVVLVCICSGPFRQVTAGTTLWIFIDWKCKIHTFLKLSIKQYHIFFSSYLKNSIRIQKMVLFFNLGSELFSLEKQRTLILQVHLVYAHIEKLEIFYWNWIWYKHITDFKCYVLYPWSGYLLKYTFFFVLLIPLFGPYIEINALYLKAVFGMTWFVSLWYNLWWNGVLNPAWEELRFI